MQESAKIETKRILIYIGITFLITYGYCFGIIYPMANTADVSSGAAVFMQLLIAGVMFFPAVGVLLTRLVTREGFRNCWIRLNLKGNIKTYLFAYFGPGILTLSGAAIYFLIFPDQFDLQCGYLQATLEASGTGADMIPIPLGALLLLQTGQALLMGPLINFVTCFGEEWGWRGYLLPKMAAKLPMIPVLLINGVIWGLWHAPLTMIGHNYGVGYAGFPFAGIAAMCIFCTVVGVFLSYVSMKTHSCIPAVLGHGALNSISAVGIYFTVDGGNPFVGPAPTGIIGGLPYIITAAIIIIFYFRKQDKKMAA